MKEMVNPMTREGYNKIAEEHRQLIEEERPKMVDNMATAAAEGDRSENAEYIYSKKRIREIDKRLRYLTTLLKDVEIVNPQNIRSDRVEFGATITVADDQGAQRTWTIVGVGESDVDARTISWKSPLARAFWGKRIGEIASVERPAGDMDYELIDLHYAGKRMA